MFLIIIALQMDFYYSWIFVMFDYYFVYGLMMFGCGKCLLSDSVCLKKIKIIWTVKLISHGLISVNSYISRFIQRLLFTVCGSL